MIRLIQNKSFKIITTSLVLTFLLTFWGISIFYHKNQSAIFPPFISEQVYTMDYIIIGGSEKIILEKVSTNQPILFKDEPVPATLYYKDGSLAAIEVYSNHYFGFAGENYQIFSGGCLYKFNYDELNQ